MTHNISGIPVEINKKNIKNMRLYVKPPDGKVAVSAPLSMRNEDIEKFVREKAKWIKRQVNKFQNQPRQSERKYVTGETMYVWGRRYYLQIEYGGRYSLVLSGEKVIFTVRKGSTVDQREKHVREWYRELLEPEIARLLPKWEKKTGLKTESWHIKYMISRWGSCKPKQRKIWLSVLLAKKMPECLDYIILHELLHFIERGHNARFYSLFDKYMPKWREIKKILNSVCP
ncbi:MAG: M48 family metallopeptidase [Treponema sp.]|nr:M48 family metallopeptidase [Treponema sp.]